MKRFVDVVQYLVLAGTVVFVIALFANEPAPSDGAAVAPAASDADGDGTGGDGDTPATVDGGAVYDDNCAGCHGGDGSGGVGPALAGGAVVDAFPDPADQIAVITEGRNGMPGFGGSLSAEEIQAVTDYTRDDL